MPIAVSMDHSTVVELGMSLHVPITWYIGQMPKAEGDG